MHGLIVPCPSKKKKNKQTIIWMTEMSEIFRTENFIRENKHNLNFFSPMVNSGTLIYLFRSTDLSGTLQSVRHSVVNQKR